MVVMTVRYFFNNLPEPSEQVARLIKRLKSSDPTLTELYIWSPDGDYVFIKSSDSPKFVVEDTDNLICEDCSKLIILGEAHFTNIMQALTGNRYVKRLVLNLISTYRLDEPSETHIVLTEALKGDTLLRLKQMNAHLVNNVFIKKLCAALAVNSSINYINLYNNKINSKGAEFIAAYLTKNRRLRLLDLSGNKIGDTGVAVIVEALKHHPSLSRLSLNACDIGDEGAAAIADLISVNKSIVNLGLINNRITDRGAEYIGDSLNNNFVLKRIMLFRNPINQKILTKNTFVNIY